MLTKISVWNQALGAIGVRSVASENERTPEAIQCSLYWDEARRTALSDYAWSFAQVRTILAEVSVPNVYSDEWKHAYQYPPECLHIHGIHERKKPFEPFQVVRAENGTRIILTNAICAIADYTRDVPDVSSWDDNFARAVSLCLSMRLITPLLKGNTALQNEIYKQYARALPSAATLNANERKTRKYIDSWLCVRKGACL